MRLPSALASIALIAAAASAQLPGTQDDGVFVTASPIHRAAFSRGDRMLDLIIAKGAARRIEDYGSFLYAIVDERPLGGRATLLSLGLDLRDRDAVIGFSGVPIDTSDGATIAQSLAGVPAAFREQSGIQLPSAQALRIVQFIGPVRDLWLDRLAATGAEVITYVASNAYVVSANASGLAALEAMKADPAVQWIAPYEPWFKVAPELRSTAQTGSGRSSVTIQLVAGEEAMQLVAGLAQAGFETVRPPDVVLSYLNIHVSIDDGFLRALAAHPAVFAIEPLPPEERLDEAQGQIMAGNLVAGGGSPTGPGYLAWLASKGFSQSGQFAFAVDVMDDGIDRGSTTDVNDEFRVGGATGALSRIIYNNNYTSDPAADGGGGHGNVNASIVGGYNGLSGAAYEDALGFNYGLGICPFVQLGNSKVFSNGSGSQFTQPTATRLANAYNAGARISSNSWGYTAGNNYNSDTQAHDMAVRDAVTVSGGNQEMSIVFAAGNSGPGANTVRPPGTGKNIITVGAEENVRQTGTDGCGIGNSGADNANDIISFSGRGPCSDSRKKPDLVAPGTHIQGAASRSPNYNGVGVCNQYWPAGQTLYAWSSGTSHSTPGTAGAAALVRQFFINQGWGTPSPAMVKACLMSSTRYMTGVSANDTLWSNSQGMGAVNLGTAFDTSLARIRVDETQVLGNTGETYTVSGSIVSGSQPVRVALVWTDAPGPTVGNAYVNNLDLEVTINGTLYRGNNFSGASSIAGGVADVRNNAEFVFLPAGTTGSISVTVRATNIVGNGVPNNADSSDQDFALLVCNATTSATPDFSLSASPGTRTITQGQSTTYTVSNVATGGFASNITLSATPAISGVTYGFSPNPMAANGSSTLSVTTTGAASTGTFTVTISGTDGSITRTTTTSLTINPAPVPDFSLSASPGSQTITQGGSTSYTVSNVATGGFASNITLSATPAISGVTYGFSPNPMAANGSSTLSVTTTGSASTGTFTVTISGTDGSITRTTTTSLTINPAPVPDFSLSASPGSQTITQGGSTSYTVSNVATGGFASNITLSATPAISGVTYAFSPNPMAANGSSTLSVTTTGSASTGTFTITISGTDGSITRTTTTSLTINPVPVPDFSLSASPGTRTITQGQSTTYTVSNVATGGFASTITLSASPAIAGVTYAFSPNPMAANGSSTLTVTTTGSAATGTTTVTISGTGGALTRTTTVSLTINPAVAGSQVKTYSTTANLVIPDNNATGVTSSTNVALSQTISSIAVTVNITHTYQGDLRVTLIAPGGAQRILHNQTGAGTDNIVTTYSIMTTPFESLTTLYGTNTAGVWQLRVQDLAALDVGTLNSWAITFNGEQSASPALAIPDNNATGVTSVINYTATGNASWIRVRVNITHTYIGDLVVTLIGPDGTAVILHNRAGGSADNIVTEYPEFTVPAQSFGAFAGKQIAGNWSLRVQDLAAADVGTLNSWTLCLNSP